MESLLLGLLLGSLPVSFVLAFAVGANDVANSFGTSFGSGVLTLRQCCILATIFETLGAVLLGYNVSETVRKGVFDIELYNDQPALLATGYFAALIGSALWNLIATMLKLPVSGTHSILGAVLGFTLVARGLEGIKYLSLSGVVASWFVSPILSGFAAVTAAMLVVRPLIGKPELLSKLLPMFYATCFFANAFSILFMGPPFLAPFESLLWSCLFALAISVAIGAVAFSVARWWWLPRQRAKLGFEPQPSVKSDPRVARYSVKKRASTKLSDDDVENGNAPDEIPVKSVLDKDESERESLQGDAANDSTPSAPNSAEPLFTSLQVLTACFGAFAHGANDVSNAIGPLIALFLIHRETSVWQTGSVPFYLFLFGGFGISCGVWALGRRVIETIGKDLSKQRITPSVGFTVELSSSLTVLIASKLGLPISTTHCKVGAVVSLAWLGRKLGDAPPPPLDDPESPKKVPDPTSVDESKDSEKADTSGDAGSGVNWKLVGEIAAAWLLTVPFSAAVSALAFVCLRAAIPGVDNYYLGNTPYWTL